MIIALSRSTSARSDPSFNFLRATAQRYKLRVVFIRKLPESPISDSFRSPFLLSLGLPDFDQLRFGIFYPRGHQDFLLGLAHTT